MENWPREHAFLDLFWSMPEIRDNPFIQHLYHANKEEEDPSYRSPPITRAKIAAVIKKPIPVFPEHSSIIVVMAANRPWVFIKRRKRDE